MAKDLLLFCLFLLLRFVGGDEAGAEQPESDLALGTACRRECSVLASYGAGICAGLSGFGIPVACLLTGLGALPCAAAQGVLAAFGGYCTSGAPSRVCEVEGEKIKNLSEMRRNSARKKAMGLCSKVRIFFFKKNNIA